MCLRSAFVGAVGDYSFDPVPQVYVRKIWTIEAYDAYI